jgi:peptide/nickel transport system substrate-binding protein
MNKEREHPGLKQLKQQFNDGKLSRREFIRYSTLLGVSATAAYGMMGMVAPRPASAADMPKGGTVRISMRVLEVVDPHTYSWLTDSNQGRGTHEYLTKTGTDNVTRPYLAEKWEATEDLKTWTLNLQKIKWHNGRDFTADDVIWNINHCLDPNTGSSVLGLMKGYMLEEYETGEKDDKGNPKKSTRLWDANAIEKVDDHTVRLNLKAAQVAVPEHLFHYPFAMLDPEEGGKFGPGSNGTGPYPLVEQSVGESAVLRKRDGWWGGETFLDEVIYVDLGDDPSATVGALASQQVHGQYSGDADINTLDVLKSLPHLNIQEVITAGTGVARLQMDREEFKDPRISRAMRLAVDTPRCLELAYRNIGSPGEHHHVCPVHPDYKELPFMARDVEAAKQLLADAGHPDGIDMEIASKKDPAWELQAVQAMVEQWKDANIRVNINLMPSAQFWDVWDKVPFGFTSWAHRPLGFMVLALGYRSGVPWNESRFDDAEFDTLLTQAEGTLDVDERREILGQIEMIMQERGPITQPLWRGIFAAFDQRVVGYKLHPTGYIFAEELGWTG